MKDLKQRGLLDTTLVHWGGEIGRLPVSEGDLDDTAGRDHNGQGFSIWLAGGGIKGGMTYGATDEVGHRAAENVVTPNDFQATLLHLLGLDHDAARLPRQRPRAAPHRRPAGAGGEGDPACRSGLSRLTGERVPGWRARATSGCQMRNARCQMPDSKFKIQDSRL